MEHIEKSLVTLTSKISTVEEVTLAGEDLTKEVKVENKAEELSIGAIYTTSWGIDHLNVHRRKT